ncbi:MAG: GNAT family N-acetyltransferase [Candidatus Promineifilaceae bacterium]|nr:GNAT family N-acetyltransferase [Candidatus Promineifilaceae bacterium]
MIRLLQPGDEAALEAFLQPKISSSMFLISNLRKAGLADNGRPHEGTYAAVFEDDQIVAVAGLFWNGSLILQSPPSFVGGLLQAVTAASNRPIMRLIGPQEQVQTVIEQYQLKPTDFQMDEPEMLYQLQIEQMTIPAPLRRGEWHGRLLQARDLETMTRWRVGYAVEALGEIETAELWQQMRTGVERYLDRRQSWILEDRSVPVSTSSFNATTAEAVQVGGVWTPPEWRSRGYGRGAVAASLLGVQKDGVQTAILFTGEANVPAQKAYEALGFRHIGDYRITLLKAPLQPPAQNSKP